MFKLNVKLTKDNDKLENHIICFEEFVEFFENSDKILGEEIVSIKSESLKSDQCKSCESLKNEVTNLYETLEKFTKFKDKLDFILSNPKTYFDKNGDRL